MTNHTDKTLKAFTDQAKQAPTGFAHMLTGFMFDLKDPKEVVIAAKAYDSTTEELIQKIRGNYSPNKGVLFKEYLTQRNLKRSLHGYHTFCDG